MKKGVTILIMSGIVLMGFNACRTNDRNTRQTESFNSAGSLIWVIILKQATSLSTTTTGDHWSCPTIGLLKAISVRIILQVAVAVRCPEVWAGTGKPFRWINPMKVKRYSSISMGYI